MIPNIDKTVKATLIEKRRGEYYELKKLQEGLPKRIKNAEIAYYKEGGCNLNDSTDTKRCGLEYYLDIKKQERIKSLESFANKMEKNSEQAEELNNYGIFDNIKLSNLFNKKIEGMTSDGNTCNWKNNVDLFKNCSKPFVNIKSDDNNDLTIEAPCKYNNDLTQLIDELNEYKQIQQKIGDQTQYLNKISKVSSESVHHMSSGIKDYHRKSMIDYRNATFYDKHTESYINTIDTLKNIYWFVLVVLTCIFIYKKHYKKDPFGYIVLITFILFPLILIKPIANLIMLTVKRYYFIDTLYFTVAITSVLLGVLLYFITTRNSGKINIDIPKNLTNPTGKPIDMQNAAATSTAELPTTGDDISSTPSNPS